jgi:squalene-associated FAD-dependent desaturase
MVQIARGHAVPSRTVGVVTGNDVLIIGGGLAGLAAATALAPRGFRLTVLESRNRLGGRASSFQDATTGQLIDACQHVSMGCCTNLAHFFRTVGIDHYLAPQPSLYFMTADRRVSQFRSDHWPAPLHLARSFLTAHFLTMGEKLRVAWGLACLQRASADADPPFQEWLFRHGQTQRIIDRFWGLVLTSALNESCDRIGLRYARKVFVEGFLSHRRGFEVEVPTVPLGQLYGDELQTWLDKHGVRLELNQGVRRIEIEHGDVRHLLMRQGPPSTADWYICTVPFERLLDLLSPAVTDEYQVFCQLKKLEFSPITSVHVWLDQPIMALPHAVLVGCAGQWVFNRGETAPGEFYLQVVVSASRQFRGLGHQEVERLIVEELLHIFPASAKVLRTRVVTEHAATFSAVPGVDRFRPLQISPIDNLFLAGDWTATGWPATMEGAVRSGYLAAEALLHRMANAARIVQPDLTSGGR